MASLPSSRLVSSLPCRRACTVDTYCDLRLADTRARKKKQVRTHRQARRPTGCVTAEVTALPRFTGHMAPAYLQTGAMSLASWDLPCGWSFLQGCITAMPLQQETFASTNLTLILGRSNTHMSFACCCIAYFGYNDVACGHDSLKRRHRCLLYLSLAGCSPYRPALPPASF